MKTPAVQKRTVSRLRHTGAMRWLSATLLILAMALVVLPWWKGSRTLNATAWQAPNNTGYAGPHAKNDRLTGLKLIELNGEEGPEHLVQGIDGQLYATVASGKILKIDPQTGRTQTWAQTDGRILGFEFNAAGELIGADAFKGLVRIKDGKTEVLASQVSEGDPIQYADAVAIDKDGTVYFTDASRRFGAKTLGGTFIASVYDMLEHSCTGRVLAYSPASLKTEVVVNGLCFANGITIDPTRSELLVAETGMYRVLAMPTSLRNASMVDPAIRTVLSQLPGYPDNLMAGQNGLMWVGLAKPRSGLIDAVASLPGVRTWVMGLPSALWPIPKPYGHVIAFRTDGTVVWDGQDPTGAYPETTGVTQTRDRMYIQSLHAHSIGYRDTPPELK